MEWVSDAECSESFRVLNFLNLPLELPIGKEVNFLVGFHNKGQKDFILDTLDASFRYSQDFGFYLQNVSFGWICFRNSFLDFPPSVLCHCLQSSCEAQTRGNTQLPVLRFRPVHSSPLWFVHQLGLPRCGKFHLAVCISFWSHALSLFTLGEQPVRQCRFQWNHFHCGAWRRFWWRNILLVHRSRWLGRSAVGHVISIPEILWCK